MRGRDIDRGAREFVRKLETLQRGGPVTGGVHADDGSKQRSGAKRPLGDLVVIQECEGIGGKGIKAGGRSRQRSWMRRTFAKSKRQLRRELGEAAVVFLQGGDLQEEFKKPGVTLQEAIIDASGEDTGQLHQAMTVRVRGETVADGRGGAGVEIRRRLRRARKAVGSFYRRVRNRIRGRV